MGQKTIRNITKVFRSTQDRLFGRVTTGTGRGEELTDVQVRSLLSVLTTAEIAAAYQPLDSDLTTIAGLTATTDSFLQSKSSAWAARTISQVKTDLGLTGTNSGDQNVFTTIAVSGQSDVVSDAASDTLTLVAGTGITITTNASTDSITITASGGSGTVTATGGSLTANSVVLGAGTTDTKVVAGFVTDGVSILSLGVPGSNAGKIQFAGSTSGYLTLQSPAVSSVTISFPNLSGTVCITAAVQTLTNKTIAFGSNTLTDVMSLTTAQSVTAGIKKTFQADATNSGLAFAGVSADPSSLTAGDIWYRTDTEKITYRAASTTQSIVTEALTQTITGVKTMSGLNSILVSSSGLTIRNPANTFKYTITAAAILADRTLTLPLTAGTLALTSDITGTNSGTNTGDQTITLTGNVTGSGTGSFAATIANGVITIAMLSATGTPSATTFLRGDNTWSTPSGSGTVTATGGSLTANAIVLGAGTTDTKVVAGITTDGTAGIVVGVASSSNGTIKFNNNLGGDTSIIVLPSATTGVTITLPTVTGTVATLAGTETFTNKTLTSPTMTSPVLGTVASGNVAACTGYTVANLAGLGTGVATFLATPSSANLITAVTDETGTGSLVFATSPTLTTPTIGVALATSVRVTEVTNTPSGTTQTITLASGNHQTLALTSATGTVTATLTVPASSSAGTIIVKQHASAAKSVTWAVSSGTIQFFGAARCTSSDAVSSVRCVAWRWDGSIMWLGVTELGQNQ